MQDPSDTKLGFWSPITGDLNAQERYLIACYIPINQPITLRQIFTFLHRKLMNEMTGIGPSYWTSVLGDSANSTTRGELAFELTTPLMKIVDKVELDKESDLWIDGVSTITRPQAMQDNFMQPTFEILLGV